MKGKNGEVSVGSRSQRSTTYFVLVLALVPLLTQSVALMSQPSANRVPVSLFSVLALLILHGALAVLGNRPIHFKDFRCFGAVNAPYSPERQCILGASYVHGCMLKKAGTDSCGDIGEYREYLDMGESWAACLGHPSNFFFN